MIKTIIFDGGGVIYKRPKEFYDFVDGMLSTEQKLAWAELKMKAKRGEISIRKVFEKLDINLDEFMLTKINLVEDNTDGVLEDLKNFKLVLLSDTMVSIDDKKSILENLGLSEYFDYVFCSSELGFTKHSKECFELVFSKTSAQAEETLFIGDKKHEIETAKSLGMLTVCVGNKAEADFNITSLGELKTIIKDSTA